MFKRNLLSAVLGLAFAHSVVDNDGGGASTLLDLDEVLGQNIDGVEDAPEFVTPPAGSYVLSVNAAKAEKYKTTDKDSGNEVEKVRLKLIYSVSSVVELEDAEEAPPAVGALFSEQFMTNPDGLSYFKRQAKNILGEDNIKGATISQILQELESGAYSFNADVKLKVTNKKVDGQAKKYTNVQVRIKPQNPAELPATV